MKLTPRVFSCYFTVFNPHFQHKFNSNNIYYESIKNVIKTAKLYVQDVRFRGNLGDEIIV